MRAPARARAGAAILILRASHDRTAASGQIDRVHFDLYLRPVTRVSAT